MGNWSVSVRKMKSPNSSSPSKRRGAFALRRVASEDSPLMSRRSAGATRILSDSPKNSRILSEANLAGGMIRRFLQVRTRSLVRIALSGRRNECSSKLDPVDEDPDQDISQDPDESAGDFPGYFLQAGCYLWSGRFVSFTSHIRVTIIIFPLQKRRIFHGKCQGANFPSFFPSCVEWGGKNYYARVPPSSFFLPHSVRSWALFEAAASYLRFPKLWGGGKGGERNRIYGKMAELHLGKERREKNSTCLK